MRYANGVGLPDDLGSLTPFAVPVIFCTDFLRPPLIRVCAGGALAVPSASVLSWCSLSWWSLSVSVPRVWGRGGDLHAVKHLRYTESLPCLNGTTASRYVEENFQKTVGFLIKA